MNIQRNLDEAALRLSNARQYIDLLPERKRTYDKCLLDAFLAATNAHREIARVFGDSLLSDMPESPESAPHSADLHPE